MVCKESRNNQIQKHGCSRSNRILSAIIYLNKQKKYIVFFEFRRNLKINFIPKRVYLIYKTVLYPFTRRLLSVYKNLVYF